MNLSKFFAAFCIGVLVLVNGADAQLVRITPSAFTFNTPVLTTKADSITVDINNSGCGYLQVYYATCGENCFRLGDTTGFILAPAAAKSIKLKFSPRQNIEYNSVVIFHTNAGDFGMPVKGYGKFVEAYYDSTYNKFDEQLKSALNTITGANYQSYSYNAARDKMFMEFDNKKVNGQGATQNTLECIYTGRLAVGYTSRTDCQTNNSFNTEHTWPQSLFSSNLPMVSDLNHLFPTDDAANNYRGNNPFGMVSSPSWTNGGSKGISTLFEPRDAQKGRTARAMLYFAIRYNNPSYGLVTFFGPQEAILRTWCMQFLPDAIDKKRNDDIFGFQKNRNPFIDHPEFLERITTIATNSVAPTKAMIWTDNQAISGKAFVFDSINYKVILYNSGNTTINCTKVQCVQNNLTVSASAMSCAKQASIEFSLSKYITANTTIMDTLLIENSSTNLPSLKIPIQFDIAALKINASKTNILASNDSAVLNITSNGSVSWNNGSTGKSIVVKTAGVYFATVTDSIGCHRSDSITISKSGNGINTSSNQQFEVFPNPAGDYINIRNTATKSVKFALINAIGQCMHSVNVDAMESMNLNISSIAPGIYYLQSENGVGVKVVKK